MTKTILSALSLAAVACLATAPEGSDVSGKETDVLPPQTIDPAEEVSKRMNKWLTAVPLFIDNGYTQRALFYGIASACTRQVDYIQNRLQRGNAAKLRSLTNTATAVQNGAVADVGGADDSDNPNANQHSIADQIAEISARMRQNAESINEMNLLANIAIKHHDSASLDLNLPTWAVIQAGSAGKAAAASGLIAPDIAAMMEAASAPVSSTTRRAG